MSSEGPVDGDVHDRLMAERTHAAERLVALEAEFGVLVDAGTGTNIDDEHDPEGATIAFERARVGALLDQARGHLADIDDALRRLDHGGYGVCERCGHAIAPERLAARPVARTCISCAG
jgi:DnaK suppressor protein